MLWSIPRLLCRPPAGFEALVGDHFRRCSGFVLRACEAYLQERCAIGTLDGEARARADGSGEPRRCSEGFRIALHSVLPQLVRALTESSADGCGQFET
jgi:ubiquitin-conjugating enzyme E2 O